MASSVQGVTTWWQYVQKISGGESQRQIAARLGLSPSTVSRWDETPARADNVAAFAREYGRPVLEAFIAAGVLTYEEARATITVPDIGQLSADELLAEIRRRIGEEVVGNAEHPAPMNPTGGSPVKRHLSAVESPNPTVDEPATEKKRAARKGRPGNMPDTTTGEESQDDGSMEPS